MALLEKWKGNVDQGNIFAPFLTVLSKAFDCLPHAHFIFKIEACGFDTKALRYLSFVCKKSKLDRNTGLGMKLNMVFHKVLYLVLYFATSIYVTYFSLCKMLT